MITIRPTSLVKRVASVVKRNADKRRSQRTVKSKDAKRG
jgi:hypothetical protein